MNLIIPTSPIALETRLATMDDWAFIDSLQKAHHRGLGFFPRQQMEGYLKAGWVLLAQEARTGERLGYCASRDRYQKRDELGAIFQLCVAPVAQRKLIGAMLVKSVFERAAYGCRLFCCWCAQDIEANHFWEAMGFVPLAFRAGSRAKGAGGQARVHIFWQRRIRADDTTTPYWFPFQTAGGSIREDRIVLPIPPGVHWSDAKPIVLPGLSGCELPGAGDDEPRQLPKPRQKKPRLPAIERTNISVGGLRLGPPVEAKPEKRAGKIPTRRKKNDPRFVTAARELRDRWLERVNEDPSILQASGKYQVSKSLAAPTKRVISVIPELPSLIAA